MELEQAKIERAKHLIRKGGIFQRDDGKCSSVIHLTRGGEIPTATRKIKGKGKDNIWLLCDECADDFIPIIMKVKQ